MKEQDKNVITVSVEDDINVKCYEKTMEPINGFSILVGTNGHKGGDSAHGSRTFIQFENVYATDMRCEARDINGKHHEIGLCDTISLIFAGDAELDCVYEALKFAVEKLGKYTKGTEEDFEETPQTPSYMERRYKAFNDYINELCRVYRKNNKLVGMAEIRSKYGISGVTKEVFYASGLQKTKGSIGREYTDKLYECMLDKTKEKTIPQYK